MNPYIWGGVLFVGAFFLGSIPWGYLAGRCRGIDIRQHGSGNIGATNVFRVMGKGWGSLVLLLDFLKGLSGALIASSMSTAAGLPGDIAALLGGTGAILGHNFTPWLGFKGGKGIASSAGVLFGITPVAGGAALVVWVLVFFTSRYVSLASIAAAVSLPVSTLLLMLQPQPPALPGGTMLLLVFCLLACTMAILRHTSNIKRLLAGTESRFGKKQPPSTDAKSEPTSGQ